MICWLASYPKSGNTWVRAFLANWLADRQVHVNELPDWGLGGGDTRADLYESAAGGKFTPQEVPKLRVDMQRDVALRPGITFFKTHNARGKIDGYATIDPHSTQGAVYIIRDPRDVAVSYAHHYGVSVDAAIDFMDNDQTQISDGDSPISQYLASWRYHVKSWIQESDFPVLVLRYEDMKDNPVKAFKKVLRFLGQPVRNARLKRAVRHCSFNELKRQEEKTGFQEASDKTERFFREGKAGGWKDVLTSEQAGKIETRHRDMMERYGYLT